jgi:anti-sigma factor RsiW
VRSKISDQDLTDYALDELPPNERLYVESMLAVSEECRNDVYETIDAAMMLEEGFEREDGKIQESLGLTLEQRRALLDVRMPNYFVRRSVAVLAAAAAVAFALVTRDQWLPQGPAQEITRVSTKVSNYVNQAVSVAEGEDFVNQLQNFRKDSSKWLPSQPVGGSAVFGPPSSLNIESAPYSPLDLTQ